MARKIEQDGKKKKKGWREVRHDEEGHLIGGARKRDEWRMFEEDNHDGGRERERGRLKSIAERKSETHVRRRNEGGR